jgi:hypothetical protein
MIEWLQQFWESLTWARIIFGSIALVISIFISYALIVIVIVNLPANYFSSEYASVLFGNKPFWMRWGATIFKNIIGGALIILGIIMLVGPGPGLLTILLGLIMMDIPGKRPLEARIIKQPTVLSAVNRLRARYRRPPLIMD